MNKYSYRFFLAVVPAMLLAAGSPQAEVSGDEGRSRPFNGRIEIAEGECAFTIDIERTSFLVTTVAGKYRFVRMLINCSGEGRLNLSSGDDRLEMLVDNDDGEEQTAVGILSLRRFDSALWDGFDFDMQDKLAYPAQVRVPDRVYVFAYFPVEQAQFMPREFRYTIASLDETIELRYLATMARD